MGNSKSVIILSTYFIVFGKKAISKYFDQYDIFLLRIMKNKPNNCRNWLAEHFSFSGDLINKYGALFESMF